MDWISGYRLPGSLLPPDLEGAGVAAATAAGGVSPPLAAVGPANSNSLINMWASNIKQEAAGNNNSSSHNSMLGLGGGGGHHSISTPGSIKGRLVLSLFLL